MLEKKQFSIILLCAFIIGMPLVNAFSTNVPGRYIFKMDAGPTIDQAINTIQEEVPDVSII